MAQVLEVLPAERFLFMLKKCAFMVPSITFLGYVISGDGVRVNDAKIQAIVNWPPPTSVSQVHNFHILAGFYRRFIVGFSTVMAPITNLMSASLSVEFRWTTEANKAFTCIKELMTMSPILALPDFDQLFKLFFDPCLQRVSNRHAKWTAYLQPYTFHLKYNPGKENQVADALSRRVHALVTLRSQMFGFDEIRDLYPTDVEFGLIFSTC